MSNTDEALEKTIRYSGWYRVILLDKWIFAEYEQQMDYWWIPGHESPKPNSFFAEIDNRQVTPDKTKDIYEHATEFTLKTKIGDDVVKFQARDQQDGKRKWVIQTAEYRYSYELLSRTGNLIIQKRDQEKERFIKTTQFDSLLDCLTTWDRYERRKHREIASIFIKYHEASKLKKISTCPHCGHEQNHSGHGTDICQNCVERKP